MRQNSTYPFYNSLRFRFGLLFGFIFLLFISVIIFFIYRNVLTSLQKSFQSRLQSGAYVLLQKTEVNPLIITLPQKGEYYLLTYHHTKKTDTLFNNLPTDFEVDKNTSAWRFLSTSKTLETGGVLHLVYVLPATDFTESVARLQTLLFIYIPLAFIASLFLGYLMSGFLLQPINTTIGKASNIDLQSNTDLLQVPEHEDELHELIIVLNRMLDRIHKQSQQQNAFFASASHELRTPLSNMLTQLQTLQKSGNISDKMVVYDNQIEEVKRLQKTVNDFLLMSQLKSGTTLVNKTYVSLPEICFDYIEHSRDTRHSFQLQLQPEEGSFTIWADENHIQVVIKNLLDNALKYGALNSVIRIHISENEATVTLIVTNETEHPVSVENLTKEFMKQDSLQDGFGLGLWIVEQLLRLHGASFSLSSTQDTFSARVIFHRL